MLDKLIFEKFIQKIDHTSQLFYVWIFTNNEFANYQRTWAEKAVTNERFKITGRKYKNFFDVTIPALQHAWFLALARLLDPAYYNKDKNKPRLSFYYILELLEDQNFRESLQKRMQQPKYELIHDSLKEHRNNFLAHNDLKFLPTEVSGGVNDLFKEFYLIIEEIKLRNQDLGSCRNINLDYIETLSQAGVDEIFSKLVL
jgi:hypothetical protein